ncbi:MAG: ABC transporter ATP-binding protein [Chelatococcus sp.]|nr:MAG: ABC transporter ATP-binding protein [Chelatococcus sp.]
MTIRSQPGGVEFRHVTRRFDKVVAVDDVSFTVEPGTLVTLLGPSGCGKTTTLRMIAGLESVSEGQVLIGGVDVTQRSASERNVSMVFQSYALFPHMTVLENVAFGLEMSGMAKAARQDKAAEGLKLVGLAGYERRLPSALSGGQQQRVAVARALVLEPQVLLFDEPLSNLDAKLRRRMRDDIRDLQQSLGLTSVYVTHDQEEALAVSDRIIVMNRAVIAQQGTPADLYERPASRFVADFIGGANLIDAEVARRDPMAPAVTFGGITLPVPGLPEGDEVAVAVRPKAVRLHAGPGEARLPVSVRKATYLGSHMEYVLDSAIGELFVVSDDVAGALPTGSSGFVGFGSQGIAVVPR